jgi:exosortase F-associated protein
MKRWIIAAVAVAVLLVSFQVRGLNLVGTMMGDANSPELPWMLVLNKLLRYIVNDMAALALIWVLFQRRDFLRFSFWVLLFGLIVLLPVYFVGYFYFTDTLGITLSYLHRLVMNPTLMMLLIPLFYFQQKTEKNQNN